MSLPASDPRPFPSPSEARAGDALSVAAADERAALSVYGCLQLDPRSDRTRAFVAVFAQAHPLAVVAGESAPASDGPRDRIDGGGLTLRTHADGWAAAFAGGPDGIGAFELEFTPLHRWSDDAAGARHGQRARVTGELRGPEGPLVVQGSGQLTFARGATPPDAALTRELAVWVQERLTIDLCATRERSARGHDRERVQATIVEHDPPSVQPIEEARLSTTYDADGRPLRAGLELWATEESAYPRRAAGEAICAASLTTAAGRWDCAFMRWRIEAGTGIGPYAVWHPAP